MEQERWKYLKALQPSPGRYAHVSARAMMIPVPVNPKDPAAGMKVIPWVQKPGVTFCENRSARKQANREYKARWLHCLYAGLLP